LDFLIQRRGASGTVLLNKFGSLDIVNALIAEGLITKHHWHWERGTKLPEQHACYKAVTVANFTNHKR